VNDASKALALADQRRYVDMMGALVLLPETLSEHREHVKADLWSSQDHQFIVACILNLFDECHYPPTKEMLLRYISERAPRRTEQLIVIVDSVYRTQPGHARRFQSEMLTELKRQAYMTAYDLAGEAIKNGDYDQVSTFFLEAAATGSGHRGSTYLDQNNVDDRTDPNKAVYNREGIVGTGFAPIDIALYGGPAAGEEHILVADAGVGKTRMLLNLGANAALQGKKVAVVSCELERPVIEGRLDQIFAGVSAEELKKPLGRQRLNEQVSVLRDLGAYIHVVKFPEHSVSLFEVEAYIARLPVHIDVLIIDYLDKLRKVQSGENEWRGDGEHFDLGRAVAHRLHTILWTALQTTKGGADFYGGQGKKAAGDSMHQIIQSPLDKSCNRFWLQDMKARYNKANVEGMRIQIRDDGMGVDYVDEWDAEHSEEMS
jgi:hypothetical protein